MKTVLCLTAHPGSASYVPVTSSANSAKALRADPHITPTEFEVPSLETVGLFNLSNHVSQYLINHLFY